MKILLVEDHTPTASYIVKGLNEAGINAKTAADGKTALDYMISEDFDCIILDIMLPIIDGLTLLKTFRASDTATPVIMLTAKDSLEDKLSGLESGADDYLVKPFAFSELLARIKAVMRRKQPRQTQSIIVIEDLQIDAIKHKVTRGGKNIDLTKKEFNLLCLFAAHKDEVLGRTYISEQVWDINFDTETNVVDVAVKRLRNKIDDGFERKFIHTIRGVGYVLR